MASSHLIPSQALELLAPARDLECGKAALDHGADAIYVGASEFGARAAAGNSVEDIARLCEQAHRYWARVYVALNTLLSNEELPRAVELIHRLSEVGIDALIIQDMGLLECDLPAHLPLLASTQLHNATPERVRFLQDVGFSRAILARELSSAEIRNIRLAAPRIELESFVHGALCVSYSGRCYLSYALGGRSGNRGACAQPCRKAYTLVDSRNTPISQHQHLLSLRDLDLSEHLETLVCSGVNSFKIEGRLKDRAYVSTVVAHYRKKLDTLLRKHKLRRSSAGCSNPAFEPNPEKVFRRESTAYMLEGRPASCATLSSAKSLGEETAVVLDVRGARLDYELLAGQAPLAAGDGVVFFDDSGVLRGSRVNHSQRGVACLNTPSGVMPGTVLRRNHDAKYLASAGTSAPRRRIDVDMLLTVHAKGLHLRTEDADGLWARVWLDGVFERARDQGQAARTLERQLGKTGDTEFLIRKLKIRGAPLPHVPLSALNAFRRRAIEAHRGARAAQRPRLPRAAALIPPPRFPQSELDFCANVLNQKARAFYSRHGVVDIESAAESGLSLKGRRVMTMRYCILHELGFCPRGGQSLPPHAPYFLLDSSGTKLLVELDCKTCTSHLVLEGRKS